MADEENERCPSWAIKNIPLNGAVEVELDCSVPIKEGSFKGRGKDGKSFISNWHLWFGKVENQEVEWKDPDTKEKTKESGFSGKVLFFPTDKLNDKLIEVCSGAEGVKVKIGKTAEEKGDRIVKRYTVEKLDGGSKLTKDEINFIDDIKNLKNDGIEITKDMALKMAKDDYKIEEARAKELYTTING